MSYLEVKQATVHLKHTMLMLLQKKGIQQIKVKEITEQAHVSRKIMLQFYPDKYAIFYEIVKEIKKDLSEVLAKITQPNVIDKSTEQDVIFYMFFDFVQKNKAFFQIFIDRKMEPYIDFYNFFLECQQSLSDQKIVKHARAVTFYIISLYAVKENVAFSFGQICEKLHKFDNESWNRVDGMCIKITDKYREKSKVEQVLQHAFVEILLEKGKYETITISDIMKKSKIRRATFYECYRSKEELFSSILQEACCQLIKLYTIENTWSNCKENITVVPFNQENSYLPIETTIFPLCKNLYPLPNLLADMVYQIISLYMEQKRKFDRDNILDAYIFSGKILSFFLEKLRFSQNVVPI